MPRTPSLSSTRNREDRLPVNPRRKKVAPEERKRVATACNSCNIRRVKCNGENPCNQCITGGRQCAYPPVVEKVSVNKTEYEGLLQIREQWEVLLKRNEWLELQTSAEHQAGMSLPRMPVSSMLSTTPEPGLAAPVPALQSPAADGIMDSYLAEFPLVPATGSSNWHLTQPDSFACYGPGPCLPFDECYAGSDGKLLADPAGTNRFLGETAGATFLDNLKIMINTTKALVPHSNNPGTFLGSVGRYLTMDSKPIRMAVGLDPLATLPPEQKSAMVGHIRFFLQDGSGSFPSGGIMYWPWRDADYALEEPRMLKERERTAPAPTRERSLALYHTAYAFFQLTSLPDPNTPADRRSSGEDWYSRARYLLGNPLDITTYTVTDVAVLAMMGMYLIESHRRDAAYVAISHAMHIGIMHGVHRGWSGDESGLRTFWTVYVLDRWLSCVMGRPPAISDDAISLPLPRDIRHPETGEALLPPPDGLCANIRLSRIAAHIFYTSYRIRQEENPDKAIVHIQRVLHMLARWKAELPPSLMLKEDPLQAGFGFGVNGLDLGRDRACLVLHMMYNQLIILAVRPAFLIAVQKAVAAKMLDQPHDINDHPLAGMFRDACDAARVNIRLGRSVHLLHPSKKLLVADLHNIFNAAVIVLLYNVVFPNLRTQDELDVYWVTEMFLREEQLTGSEFAKDCYIVLHDLRALVPPLREVVVGDEPKVPGEGIVANLRRLQLQTPPTAVTDDGSILFSAASSTDGQSIDESAWRLQPLLRLLGIEGDRIQKHFVSWMNSHDFCLYTSFLS